MVFHTALAFEAVRSIDFRTLFMSTSLVSVSASALLSRRIACAMNLTYATRVVCVASESFGLYSR